MSIRALAAASAKFPPEPMAEAVINQGALSDKIGIPVYTKR
jgi:hypothetical protein